MLHYHVTKRVRLAGGGGGGRRQETMSSFPAGFHTGQRYPEMGMLRGSSGLVLSLRDLNWVMTIKGLMFLLFEKL